MKNFYQFYGRKMRDYFGRREKCTWIIVKATLLKSEISQIINRLLYVYHTEHNDNERH